MDLMEQLSKKIAEEITAQIGSEMLRGVDSYLDEDAPEMQYDSKKQQIDSVYLHDVKKKTELLLDKIIEKHELTPYLSDKYRYRIKSELWHESKYKELYDQRKDLDGKYLASGYDYVPVDFEDWTKTYFPDYITAVEIYSNMCEYRRVLKDDLKKLNKIARRYIKGDTDDSN